MSEMHARLAAMLAGAIRDDWQSFGAIATSPCVQAFCAFESSYDEERLANSTGPWSLFRFDPAGTSFDTEAASRLLSHASWRTDVTVRGLVAAYCKHKRRAVPDEAYGDATWEILANVISGGLPKLRDYVYRSEKLPDAALRLNQDPVLDRLAVTLLMIAARARTADLYATTGSGSFVETSAPQQEVDAVIDETLREACQRVARGERHHAAPGAGVRERLFAGCMRVLRALYTQGDDPGFQRRVIDSEFFEVVGPPPAAEHLADLDTYLDFRRECFEALATWMNELLGASFRYPGAPTFKKMMRARDQSREGRDLLAKFRDLQSVYLAITMIHATRHFVDRIADGSLRWSEVSRAMMQLALLPLRERPVAVLTEETLDWEVLPADVFGPREEPRARPAGRGQPVPLDMSRIERLWSIGAGWEGAYIVRGVRSTGSASDFKTDYYVLVLPDAATGLEHAVADSPKQGRGLYVFRGEQGWRFQPPITWREAFSQSRGEPVKELGALCLFHVPTLERLLLEALTCPPEEIEQRRRYLADRRARRRATSEG